MGSWSCRRTYANIIILLSRGYRTFYNRIIDLWLAKNFIWIFGIIVETLRTFDSSIILHLTLVVELDHLALMNLLCGLAFLDSILFTQSCSILELLGTILFSIRYLLVYFRLALLIINELIIISRYLLFWLTISALYSWLKIATIWLTASTHLSIFGRAWRI